jgi:hypothetical protein
MLGVSKGNVARADHGVPPVTLCAITLRPIPHHVDTLAVWVMDRYSGPHVLPPRCTRTERPCSQHVHALGTPTAAMLDGARHRLLTGRTARGWSRVSWMASVS